MVHSICGNLMHNFVYISIYKFSNKVFIPFIRFSKRIYNPKKLRTTNSFQLSTSHEYHPWETSSIWFWALGTTNEIGVVSLSFRSTNLLREKQCIPNTQPIQLEHPAYCLSECSYLEHRAALPVTGPWLNSS